MSDSTLQRFRSLVQNYINRHHYSAALFWADKVVSLSENAAVDIYWLAQCFFFTKQYHRAIHLITENNLLRNPSCKYLAAKCHYEVGNYQLVIEILENQIDIQYPKKKQTPLVIPEIDDIVSIECSNNLLKGYAHESSENRALAAECFKAAVQADPLCYEAVYALTRHHMLTRVEEKEILSSLQLSKHCSESEALIVETVYENCINKYSAITEGLSPRPPAPLDTNLDIITAQAERLYYQCDFTQCFTLTQEVLNKDPLHTECLPIHISCLVELRKPNALFLLGHNLVDLYPESALSWYAVGCYYYLIGKNDNARRYMSKATSLDRSFGPAWIAYGHSFAAENEHDQAMAAYFKANQQMKGCHLPLLYIGMEYSLTNTPKIAEKFFREALEIAPDDPFVLQELGVVAFTNTDFIQSERYLRKSVDVIEESGITVVPEKWSTLLNNLAHACRKNNKYSEALHFHQQAVRVCPGSSSTYSDIGLVQAMMGHYEDAVVTLHKALSLHREQKTTTTLLAHVMEQLTSQNPAFPGDDAIPDLDLPDEIQGLDPSMLSSNTSFPQSTNIPMSDSNLILGSSLSTPGMHSSELTEDSLSQTPQPGESSTSMIIEDMVMEEDSPYSPGDNY